LFLVPNRNVIGKIQNSDFKAPDIDFSSMHSASLFSYFSAEIPKGTKPNRRSSVRVHREDFQRMQDVFLASTLLV
jgi:hypothetical protein